LIVPEPEVYLGRRVFCKHCFKFATIFVPNPVLLINASLSKPPYWSVHTKVSSGWTRLRRPEQANG